MQLGLAFPNPASLAGARAAGVKVVKVLADWSVIEAQRGAPAWASVDGAVDAVGREGLTPVVVLAYTPRWASLGAGPDLAHQAIYSRQPPRDLRDWERFVAAAGARYRGRVVDWQIWTQLGLPHFRGTGREYLALLQTARARLRESDPAARVALAAPAGMDVGFVVRMAQEASGAFDAVALAPEGLTPEALLRPLATLAQRVRAPGKAIWLDWRPGGADHGGRPDQAAASGLWARMLAVARAAGLDRLFAADPTRIDADLRPVATALAGRTLVGYLVRDPDVYALVFGDGSDAVLVAWATAQGRALDLPAVPDLRVSAPDGGSVPVEARDRRGLVRLSAVPVVIFGVPAALVDEARATAAARGPLLPVVDPERDYARAPEVWTRLGRTGEERGLYNQRYRSRPNGAVEPIDVDGVEAVRTSVARQVVYVYFDIDDTFLYFGEGRIPLEVTIEVWGARGARQVGFNLLYDATGGYRFTPWQWVEAREGWVTHTVRLTDASMANTWGFDFAINTAGNRAEDLIVRSVTVRKVTGP
ncbi:MAG: hypothetical protein QN187_08795 [Armatimonadota bacterium]|nr:hypothetical protein [Armatimonadota bacterium]MDR7518917.1 hypothetical protein [Armatimonadota bacterium]